MKYAALLRGINLGGKRMKMDALREMMSALGFRNVETYIASGNVVFETRKTTAANLAKRIEKAIEKTFGFDSKVIIREHSVFDEIVRNNPFEGQYKNEKEVHILFLEEKMPKDKVARLTANNNEHETYVANGLEIYCLLKEGVIASLLGKDFISKTLKVFATARNLRTVKKIAEM